jgi:hypothetical protein
VKLNTPPDIEPRYSAGKAAAVVLFRPITAVRRSDHLSLSWAWAVHVMGMMYVLGVLALLSAYGSTGGSPTLSEIRELSAWTIENVLNELDNPLAWAMAIAVALFIEATVMVSALLTMSWCAKDEKVARSYKRALRRLFLLTPHAALVVTLTGGFLITLTKTYWLFAGWYTLSEIAQFLAVAVASLWSLWVVLAALGCRSGPAVCRWPARCEGCGYQLAGLRPDQRCPECGQAIVQTLGRDIRTGISPAVGFTGWLCQTYQAVRRPALLGKRLHVMSSDADYHRCLAVTIVLLMLTSPIATGVLWLVVSSVRTILQADWDLISLDMLFQAIILGGTWIGLMLTATTVAVALGGAVIIGLIEGKRCGRNLMPAAIRSACYLSGFAVLWSFIFWVDLAVFVVVMELDLLTPIATRYNIDLELLVLGWQFGVVGLGIVIYLFLIGRATHAARHANW